LSQSRIGNELNGSGNSIAYLYSAPGPTASAEKEVDKNPPVKTRRIFSQVKRFNKAPDIKD
jgi:hypothetical protein